MSQYTALNARAAGDLDLEFGANRDGKVILSFPSSKKTPSNNITEGPDGKLYIMGGAGLEEGQNRTFGIARLHADGTADASFGDAGLVIVPLKEVRIAEVNRIVFQTHENQQKILLIGLNLESRHNVVARLHENGQLDTSFGNEGFLTINPLVDIAGYSGSSPAKADVSGESHTSPCAVLPDGRIYVITNGLHLPQWDKWVCVLTRLNSDGSLDTRFNKTGSVVIPDRNAPLYLVVSDVLVHDNKITVCGSLDGDAMVGRLNEDGSFDHGFGTEGFAILELNEEVLHFSRLALQTDGRLLAAGDGQQNPRTGLLACFTVDGRLERKFNLGAPIFESFENSIAVLFRGVSQFEGKIIVTARVRNENGSGFAVARYLSNGTLDQEFGKGAGWVFTPFGGDVQTNAMTVQKNGKILVIGQSTSSASRTMIARYLNPL